MRVVIWSGGADSTLILLDELLSNPPDATLVALTLDHPQLGDKAQRILQDKARARFKRWLWEKHRKKVVHHTVTIRLSKDAWVAGNVGQYGLFLSHLFPYMTPAPPTKSTVLFGYIRGDDHWHGKHEFGQAFASLAAVAGADMTLEYPLEWERKDDVLARLSQAGVPIDTWWTCDRPVGNKPCGECSKCEAVKPRPKAKKRRLAEVAVAVATKKRGR